MAEDHGAPDSSEPWCDKESICFTIQGLTKLQKKLFCSCRDLMKFTTWLTWYYLEHCDCANPAEKLCGGISACDC